jgi:electron transport complex protein RnfC
VGVVVLNVSTINAIREGVLYDKPLIERYVTISGSMIRNPGNYKVRIGTCISDIIHECGGLKGDPGTVIFGGPMCGIKVHDMNVPFMKGTSGILFLSKDEAASTRYTSCIRCGACMSVCPVGLMPNELGSGVEKKRMDRVSRLNPRECIQCGCCSYVCPAGRPLTYFIGMAIPHDDA